jgi:hypothetical protein
MAEVGKGCVTYLLSCGTDRLSAVKKKGVLSALHLMGNSTLNSTAASSLIF